MLKCNAWWVVFWTSYGPMVCFLDAAWFGWSCFEWYLVRWAVFFTLRSPIGRFLDVVWCVGSFSIIKEKLMVATYLSLPIIRHMAPVMLGSDSIEVRNPPNVWNGGMFPINFVISPINPSRYTVVIPITLSKYNHEQLPKEWIKPSFPANGVI